MKSDSLKEIHLKRRPSGYVSPCCPMEETWEKEWVKNSRKDRRAPGRNQDGGLQVQFSTATLGSHATLQLWQSSGRYEVTTVNKQKTVFLLLDGSMARELNIWHAGASTALSFISSSTSDLQHSQPLRLPSSQKTESQERIPNKLLLGFHFPQLESPREWGAKPSFLQSRLPDTGSHVTLTHSQAI